jgi:hypothetical protein
MSMVETIKSMVHDLDLPMFLWARTCCYAYYILNIYPHRVLKDKTQDEAFTSEKQDVYRFRVFGSLVYIDVPKEKMMKIEPFSLNSIVVGYNESYKAYKIYFPYQRKTVVSQM